MKLFTTRTVLSTVIGAALCSSAYAREDLPNYNALADRALGAAASQSAALSAGKAPAKATAKTRKALAVTAQAAPVRVALQRNLVQSADAVTMNKELGVPSFVWANPQLPAARVSAVKPELQARVAAESYVRKFAPMYGLDRKTLSGAELKNVHDTGKGVIIAKYRQRVNGIEVFAQELNVAMKRDMSLVSLSGSLSPRAAGKEKLDRVQARAGVAKLNANAEFSLSAEKAIGIAFADMGGKLSGQLHAGANQGDYSVYPVVESAGDYVLTDAIRTKPVYFDLRSSLEPAYYVEISAGERGDTSSDVYGYVISARTGKMLFRKNFTENEFFVYRAFADATGENRPWDGPQGKEGQPNPLAAPGFLPTFKSPNLFLLESGPISTGDPWLLPIASETAGNNVDAYADLASPDGYFRIAGDFRADANARFDVGFPSLVKGFTYTLNPALPANTLNNQRAAIVQLFYTNNWLHDWYYDSGFDEAAGNAQINNFGRGGVDSDPLKVEAQDVSGANNANMSTPPDGTSPRMQQFVFTHLGDSSFEIGGNKFATQAATFGPPVFSLQGDVVRFADAGGTDLGCEPAANADALEGKIALIQRGTCTFVTKVENAQNAGAIGVIVYNNAVTGLPGMGGTNPNIVIPSLGISRTDGNATIELLTAGPQAGSMAVVPSRDSTVDNLIVAHEWGHYISNRLVANALGLGNNQGRSMGEGWADFHSMLLTVEEDDLKVPNNANFGGVYAQGGYADMGPIDQAPQTTFFWGIRRVPYTTDMTKNALTFKHIEDGVPLPTDIHPVSFGADGSINSEVHDAGEIWATTLWEAYVNLLNDPRHSFAEAQDLMKRYIVAGYKLTPPSPTYLEARDALLAAVRGNDEQDFALFTAAFAKRGMGAGAVAPDRFSIDHAGVVESFSEDSALASAGFELNANFADLFCDTDGVLDVGETAQLKVTIRNNGFKDLASVTGTLSSGNDVTFANGGQVTFTDVPVGGEAEAFIEVTLNAATQREALNIDVEFTSPQVAEAVTATFSDDVNFDFVPASTFDDGSKGVSDWNFRLLLSGQGEPWALVPGLLGDDTDYIHWGLDSGVTSDTVMESPALLVGPDDNLRISWDQSFDFEYDGETYWDGGVVEYQVDGGEWQDVGGRITPAYNAVLGDPQVFNVLEGREGYGGFSDDFPTFAPASLDLSGLGLAGKSVKIRFRIGTDSNTDATGWLVDNIDVQGITNLPFTDFGADAQACPTLGLQAEAGPDITAVEGQIINIPAATGSSDPAFNATLSFDWTQVAGTPVAILKSNTAAPKVVLARLGVSRTVTLRLKVTDPNGKSSTDELNINIQAK
jgi:hypothetical protein